VLQVPVGSDTYARTQLVNMVESFGLACRCWEISWTLRRLFSSVVFAWTRAVLISFFARCRNPLCDAAVVFDDLMQETFASISCAVLLDRV
jgi:hypothetical protein